MSKHEILIPIRIVSESNQREHWSKKYKRQEKQKKIIYTYLLASGAKNLKPPALITLTRIAPRALDYDNLVSSFKGAQDTVSSFLVPGLRPGRADDRIHGLNFEYAQKKGPPKKYALEIQIESNNPEN